MVNKISINKNGGNTIVLDETEDGFVCVSKDIEDIPFEDAKKFRIEEPIYFGKPKSYWLMQHTYNKKDCVFFNSKIKSHAFVLSNHYSCNLYYEGMHFYSVEQMYEYLFFKEHGDSKMCKYVMSGAKWDAFNSVRSGAAIANDEKIRDAHNALTALEDEVVVLCNNIERIKKCHLAKWMGCADFREVLEKTGDKRLVEYAPWGDDSFGCVPVDKNDSSRVMGSNWSGRSMMWIRELARKGEIKPLEIKF